MTFFLAENVFTGLSPSIVSSCINAQNAIQGGTCVWWQIEISQFLAFFSTYIFTLQQLLEDPVSILFHIPNRYPHFGGGSQKCTQGTPPVKARKSQKV